MYVRKKDNREMWSRKMIQFSDEKWLSKHILKFPFWFSMKSRFERGAYLRECIVHHTIESKTRKSPWGVFGNLGWELFHVGLFLKFGSVDLRVALCLFCLICPYLCLSIDYFSLMCLCYSCWYLLFGIWFFDPFGLNVNFSLCNSLMYVNK